METFRFTFILLGLILPLITTFSAPAQTISNGSEVGPINPDDVFVKRMTFSTPPDLTISGAEDLFGTTNNLAYVITSMHVYFSGDYPAKRDSVGIRLWRNGEPLWGWRPPNDTYSVIDFGTGLLFEETQEPVSFKIDVTDRGGHDTGWQNSIHVDFYGYRIKKQ